MGDFKVGQRVRRADVDVTSNGVQPGTIGTVESLENGVASVRYDAFPLRPYKYKAFEHNKLQPAPEPSAPLVSSEPAQAFQKVLRAEIDALNQQRFAQQASIQQGMYGLSQVGNYGNLGQLSQQQAEAQARANQQGPLCQHGNVGLCAGCQGAPGESVERGPSKLRAELERAKNELGDVKGERDTLRAHVARLEKALDLAQRRGRR